jgi:hypothetical protein
LMTTSPLTLWSRWSWEARISASVTVSDMAYLL